MRILWLILGQLLDCINAIVNIKWLEKIFYLHKCTVLIRERKLCIRNITVMVSRVDLTFSEILCIPSRILLLPVQLYLDILHTEIARFDGFFFSCFPSHSTWLFLFSTSIMLVWQTVLPPKQPVYGFTLVYIYVCVCI